MDIPKTLFATLVKQGRMEMHLTQEALAEKLGISAAYLGDLERHKGGPSLELFCKTMQTLNISADDYVYPNQNKNNSTYLCRLLNESNINCKVIIGEYLSYENERILEGKPEEFINVDFSDMSILVVENEEN